MINGRNFHTAGPFKLVPFGNQPRPDRFRVIDREGRRIISPLPRREARKFCDLLNEAYSSGVQVYLTTPIPQ
ncbi:MAG: hypothetical protein AAGA25_01465 [Planctomycetota bacterium]